MQACMWLTLKNVNIIVLFNNKVDIIVCPMVYLLLIFNVTARIYFRIHNTTIYYPKMQNSEYMVEYLLNIHQ